MWVVEGFVLLLGTPGGLYMLYGMALHGRRIGIGNLYSIDPFAA